MSKWILRYHFQTYGSHPLWNVITVERPRNMKITVSDDEESIWNRLEWTDSKEYSRLCEVFDWIRRSRTHISLYILFHCHPTNSDTELQNIEKEERKMEWTDAMIGERERVSAMRYPIYGTRKMKRGARITAWSEYLRRYEKNNDGGFFYRWWIGILGQNVEGDKFTSWVWQ